MPFTIGLPWFDWFDGKREGWCVVSTCGHSPSNSYMKFYFTKMPECVRESFDKGSGEEVE